MLVGFSCGNAIALSFTSVLSLLPLPSLATACLSLACVIAIFGGLLAGPAERYGLSANYITGRGDTCWQACHVLSKVQYNGRPERRKDRRRADGQTSLNTPLLSEAQDYLPDNWGFRRRGLVKDSSDVDVLRRENANLSESLRNCSS